MALTFLAVLAPARWNDNDNTHTEAAKAVTRLISVIGLGAGYSRGHRGPLYNSSGVFTPTTDVQEWIMRRSRLDWTCCSPVCPDQRPAHRRDDGTWMATVVVVGRDGIIPPM
jgi:hypothetical protein